MKECKICKQMLSIEWFSPHKDTRDRLSPYCRACYSQRYSSGQKPGYRKPKKNIPRKSEKTSKWMIPFLTTYSQTGNISHSVNLVGISRRTVYKMCEYHPEFETLMRRVEQGEELTERILRQELEQAMSATMRSHAPREQYVYFIQGVDGGPIKIGITIDPEDRLQELQLGSPVMLCLRAVTKGGLRLERQLHTRFAEVRSHGEWFHPIPELLGYISNLPTQDEERDLLVGTIAPADLVQMVF